MALIAGGKRLFRWDIYSATLMSGVDTNGPSTNRSMPWRYSHEGK